VQIEKDISYREAGTWDPALNTLDIYFQPLRPAAAKRPLVVFMHGGNWSQGDKACFASSSEPVMPAWFVRQGFVFVAINFRLLNNDRCPGTQLPDTLEDLAKAIKWLKINARRYGADQGPIVIMGFSSGAHLAALLVSDESALRSHRLRSRDIGAVIAMDVPYYDMASAVHLLRSEDTGLPQVSRRIKTIEQLFGRDPAGWARASPAAYISDHLLHTAFCIISCGYYQSQPQRLTQQASALFVAQLQQQGIAAEQLHLAYYRHADLLDKFSDEAIACPVLDFLARWRSMR
jgi:acetyl esterase/lipase